MVEIKGRAGRGVLGFHREQNMPPGEPNRFRGALSAGLRLIPRVGRLRLRQLVLQAAIIDDRSPGERSPHRLARRAEERLVSRNVEERIAEKTLRGPAA